MSFKSGFVAIMGSPNVGKSTLLNRFVGMKIAIVSKKAQTTRNKVVGILTADNYQMIFLDTPGLHTPKNKLGKYMVDTAYSAHKYVDATLMVIDAVVGIKDRDEEIIKKLSNDNLIVAINKCDAVNENSIDIIRKKLKELGIDESKIVVLSALTGTGVSELLDILVDFLYEGPQYYPSDMVTDRPERFIAAELIREKILENVDDEIPHGVGIEIEKVEEFEDLTKVFAVIYCERASHKRILIGAKGSMLKKIGAQARLDMEMLFNTKVYLELWIKVKEDSRNSSFILKE